MLDTEPGGAFRFSLVDGGFHLVPDTAFRVHRCPRGEHLTHEDPPPEPCTLGAVNSDGMTGILPALDLNQTGGTRGYLGIELTKAPINPGTYFILVESIGPTPYRIRQAADFVRRAGQESEYFGAYRICTVAGGEFLDENFVRFDSLDVSEPKIAYVRYCDTSASEGSLAISLLSVDDDGAVVDGLEAVATERVGRTGWFLSRAVELHPGFTVVSSAPARAAGGTSSRIRTSPRGRLKATRQLRNVAGSVVKWGTSLYEVPLGLTLPLALYRSQPFSDLPPNYYFCSLSESNCPNDSSLFVDLADAVVHVTPSVVLEPGIEQVLRLEVEPGPDPLPGWYFRAIRLTTRLDGSARVPGGKVDVTASYSGKRDVVSIRVKTPRTLGCCGEPWCTLDCKTIFPRPATEVDLVPSMIGAADKHGVPPQYLMAQVMAESAHIPGRAGFRNAYSFRYEPTSRDFKKLTGDHGTATDMGEYGNDQRHLFYPGEAALSLGLTSGGVVSYLPCEETTDGNSSDGDPIRPLTSDPGAVRPCVVGEGVLPPRFEHTPLTLDSADPLGLTWIIPGLPDGTILQLGVKVFAGDDPWLPNQLFTQVFGREPTQPNEYRVDPVSRRVVFSDAWAQLNAQYRRRSIKVAIPPSTPAFGRGFAEGPTPVQLAGIIRAENPHSKLVPPPALESTIRQWRQQWGIEASNPLPSTNTMRRYFTDLDNDRVWKLLFEDPSFDVQGQWFAAASYGLLQVIPESVRVVIATGLPELERERIRQNVFDPLGQYPATSNPARLFDPEIVTEFAALIDAKAMVEEEHEKLSGESICPAAPNRPLNTCTWERVWKRRFRVFNSGTQGTGSAGVVEYANNIIESSVLYKPQI